jgi:hypothetical protein
MNTIVVGAELAKQTFSVCQADDPGRVQRQTHFADSISRPPPKWGKPGRALPIEMSVSERAFHNRSV